MQKSHEHWFYETTQYIISRYILVLVDPRFNIFLLARTLIFNWVWFKLVMQVFWSEQYDGIPEIKNRPSVSAQFCHILTLTTSIKTSEVPLHQPTYCQVTNIHIKHVPHIRNQKWLHPMAGSCIIWFLFLSFRRVLNVICSFLGNSPASEF